MFAVLMLYESTERILPEKLSLTSVTIARVLAIDLFSGM
jgi:hypothetical protein